MTLYEVIFSGKRFRKKSFRDKNEWWKLIDNIVMDTEDTRLSVSLQKILDYPPFRGTTDWITHPDDDFHEQLESICNEK